MKKIILAIILLFSVAVKSDEVIVAIEKLDNIAFFAESVSIAFPKKIADFVFAGSMAYDVPELGFSLRYKVDSINLDLYIYDRGLKDIPDGVSKYTQDELCYVFSAIEDLNGRKFYSDIQKISDCNGQLKSLGFNYNRTVLNLNAPFWQPPGRKQTEVILFGFRNNFFKIRITYPLEDAEKYFEKVTDFLVALDKVLHESLPVE